MSEQWIVKIKRYDGSESIICHSYSLDYAEGYKDALNGANQAYCYGVEAFDKTKMLGWGTPADLNQRDEDL